MSIKNRSLRLIKNINRLLESKYNSNYYTKTVIPYENLTNISESDLLHKTSILKLLFSKNNPQDNSETEFIPYYGLFLYKNLLKSYKNLLRKQEPFWEYPYIYQIKSPILALNLNDPNEIVKSINKEIIIKGVGSIKHSTPIYSWNELLNKIKTKNISNSLNYNEVREYSINGKIAADISIIHNNVFKDSIDLNSPTRLLPFFLNQIKVNKLLQYYDGIVIDNVIILLFKTVKELQNFIDKNAELIDGNNVRFDTGTDTNLEIPDEVLADLQKYQGQFLEKIKPSTINWFLSNQQKPYKELVLYRGTGIRYDHYNGGIDKFYKDCEELLGISYREIKREKEIYLDYDKPTSWTTKPQIARGFGMNNTLMQFVLKAIVPAEQVAIDFNLLPKQILKDYLPHYFENEVILLPNKIKAKLTSIKVNKSNYEYLVQHYPETNKLKQYLVF